MVDSGASANVLDEIEYQALPPPLLQQTKVNIHPYKSSDLSSQHASKRKSTWPKALVLPYSVGKRHRNSDLMKAVHNVEEDISAS